MAKKAFEKIMAGLEDAKAIAANAADPTTYRVHLPDALNDRLVRKLDRPCEEKSAVCPTSDMPNPI